MKKILIVVLAAAVLMGAGAAADRLLEKSKQDHATKVDKINEDLARAVAEAAAKRAQVDTELIDSYDLAISRARGNQTLIEELTKERDAITDSKAIIIPAIRKTIPIADECAPGLSIGPFPKNMQPKEEEALSYIKMRKSGLLAGKMPERARLKGNAPGTVTYFWFYLYVKSNTEVQVVVEKQVTGAQSRVTCWHNNDLVNSEGSIVLIKGWNLIIIKSDSNGEYGFDLRLKAQGGPIQQGIL